MSCPLLHWVEYCPERFLSNKAQRHGTDPSQSKGHNQAKEKSSIIPILYFDIQKHNLPIVWPKLVIYCCIMSYSKLTSLKQQIFIMESGIWERLSKVVLDQGLS